MTWEDVVKDYPNAADALLKDFNSTVDSEARFNDFKNMLHYLQEPGETHIRRTLKKLDEYELNTK